MADISSVISRTVDLKETLTKTTLRDLFVTEDKGAHVFEIHVTRAGTPVDLTGATVTGYFMRYKDQVSVPLTGSVKNGAATITLTKDCYAIRTVFSVTVCVDVGDTKHTVFVGEGQMLLNRSDSIVDNTGVIPSIEEILAQYDRMQQGADNATNAANHANAAAETAITAAGRAPYIGENGHWYIWNATSGSYVDSTDPSIPSLTFEVRTGAAGSQVLIEQSGTPEEPVIILTIPRGDTGAVDGVDYYTGNPAALGTPSPGTANGLARGDHVHPMPDALDVGAVKFTRIWANPDHKSQFAAQSLTFENVVIGANDIVMIRYATNNNATSIGMAGFAKTGQVAQLQAVIPGAAVYPEIRHRTATIHSTSIDFTDATSKRTHVNTDPNTNNSLIIPLEIYKITGVIVP